VLEITRDKGQPAEILRLTAIEKVLPLADRGLYPANGLRSTALGLDGTMRDARVVQ
jgi:hypothetical protein